MTHDFAVVFAESSDPVLRLVHRIVGDRDEAMDLVQDVFVRIWSDPDRMANVSSVNGYIFRSAYNAAINHRRDRSRRADKAEQVRDESMPMPAVNPHARLEAAQIREHLGEALDSLAGRQREAIALRFFGELTVTEIARAMSISEGSAKVHIARGLRHLKDKLASLRAEE